MLKPLNQKDPGSRKGHKSQTKLPLIFVHPLRLVSRAAQVLSRLAMGQATPGATSARGAKLGGDTPENQDGH